MAIARQGMTAVTLLTVATTNYEAEAVWPAPPAAVRADVVNFWLAESALPNRPAAEERAHQLLVVARDAEGQVARDYLAGRGINQSSIEQFQLGFAPDGWDRLTRHLREDRREHEHARLRREQAQEQHAAGAGERAEPGHEQRTQEPAQVPVAAR